ncbi:ATP-binding cassette domain-containing protein [Streptococcus marmotae]|uniref:ATP-binding cassette domain-containing protein n=1 Tax=Streptococcus marmotae TaxID=1825069 RepID=UPI00082E707F|nr:ABC transporter ATP-binding protein [Streptococcus marmotae]
MGQEALIEVRDVQKVYSKKNLLGKETRQVAVDGVTLTLYKGETLGLVGESGSGKSTLSKLILGLENPSKGEVDYVGLNPDDLANQALQIIYQDPFSALNPYLSALELVKEPLYKLPKKEADELARAILERVGITGEAIHKRPKAFSGGQRQRIGIARAVVNRPQFVVCDEPTSALDVSIQAQILQLLSELQEEFHLSYLFISHDLNVVRHFAQRIAVLYKGVLVELAPAEQLFTNPQHPYTQYLLSANLPLSPSEARKQLHQIANNIQDVELASSAKWIEIEANHFVRK